MLENNSTEWTKESIRSLRLRLGWSRSDLARRLKCSTEQIEKWEDGHHLEVTFRGELEIILRQAEACCDEVKYTPACENELDRSALEQVEFSRVKEDLE